MPVGLLILDQRVMESDCTLGRLLYFLTNDLYMKLFFREEIEQLTMKDLEYLSHILGDNKFILGDEPSEYDATVFGHLCVATWGLPDSIYEDVLKGNSTLQLFLLIISSFTFTI